MCLIVLIEGKFVSWFLSKFYLQNLISNYYDVRSALTACGWVGKYGLKDVLEALESRGKYERSAALAVFNSDLGQAVAALQRGAAHVRSKALKCEGSATTQLTQYAETLELVAMCKLKMAKIKSFLSHHFCFMHGM